MRLGKQTLQKFPCQRIECIDFNGRKDQRKTHVNTEYEELFVLIKEPDEVYFNHIFPDKRRTRNLAGELVAFLIDLDRFNSLKIMLC